MEKASFPDPNKGYTYLQTNRSDDLGSLWSTMGIDLQSNLGTMRVAPRLMIGAQTSGTANLGLPVAFLYQEGRIWTVAGTRVFSNSTTPNGTWTEDASTGFQTNYSANSDLEAFNGRIWATTETNLYSKNSGAGAWTSRDSGFDPIPHMVKYFPLLNRLYYQSNYGIIDSIDVADVVATTAYKLDFSSGAISYADCLEANSTSLWVGVSGQTSDQSSVASILQWDGISAGITKSYPLKSRYVLAMCTYEDIVYIMDGNGVLSKYVGYAFQEIGRLPFVTKYPFPSYIQRNGMIATKNGTIQVVIDNAVADSAGTVYENIPSGIWEWSEDFGFTHKYSFTYTPEGSSTITDYGQNRISQPGALFDAGEINNTTSGHNGTILAGATYFTDATTTTNGIFFDDSNNTLQKKGYFVTTWFSAKDIEDKWSRLWATFRRLLASTDSLVFKYRIHEENPTYATITWVNTTSFTTTTDITAYGPTATGFNGTQGGEVEILQGTGSASCAHITNIVNNAGTYTVTLDTAVTGVTTGTAKARFQKWIKLNPVAEPEQIRSYLQAQIGANNIRIQIKGCMTFTGDGEFFKLVLTSNPDIAVTL